MKKNFFDFFFQNFENFEILGPHGTLKTPWEDDEPLRERRQMISGSVSGIFPLRGGRGKQESAKNPLRDPKISHINRFCCIT